MAARLTWLASRALPVEAGTWTRLADEIGRDLALAGPVRLLESDHPSLVVTWGHFVPKVILPRAAQSWTGERAAIVLRHELAHIRRGDWAIQIAGELLRAICWFNPLVWIACAGLPAPAIARSSSLERRIRAMLDARLTRTPATRVARLMTAGALVAFTVALAAAQTGPVTFSGSVIDQSGAPVPGATVVLANTRNKSKFEVTSNDSGKFDFVPLPADTYALVVTLPGFKKNEATVTLSGTAMSRLVFLQLGELQETISVRAQRNQVAREDDGRKSPEYGRTAFLRDLDKCETSTSGGRVRPPHKIKDVRPIYPDGLREAGIAGKVGLKATIAVDGTVRDVQVVTSAHPDLDNAAIEAVRQWLFDGTLLNCTPVEVTMNVSVDFGIQ